MKIARTTPGRGIRGFIILVALILIGGGGLWSQGDLISPLQSTTMLISLSSGTSGFAMVSETGNAAENAAATTTTDAQTLESAAASTAAESASVGTMTLETLTAELAAAGVDVEDVSATMSAEGRSLDNLLSVVNSGRVTVADLAARLNGETTSAAQTPAETSSGLVDIHWEEWGSLAYNLWIMLMVTAVVIVIGHPAGWLVRRMKRSEGSPSM